MDDLRTALEQYYGAISENLAGLTTKLPEKPEALVLWEQVKALGIPLVAGGVQDQPYIWLMEIAVIRDVESIFQAQWSAENTTRKE